jgi:hypothetical protein
VTTITTGAGAFTTIAASAANNLERINFAG